MVPIKLEISLAKLVGKWQRNVKASGTAVDYKAVHFSYHKITFSQ